MAENGISLEDLLIDVDLGDNEEEIWAELMNQIEQGNVIPVIGPDFLIDKEVGQGYHQLLINAVAKWGGVTPPPRSFSRLLYDSRFQAKLASTKKNNDYIYQLLEFILGKSSVDPNPLLKRLLATKRFPFVITTSFTPVVEKCMQEVWRTAPRVLQFNNDAKRSMQVGFGDVSGEKELTTPTVFYLFGKVSKEPHRYVVTDLDMMAFCRTWMSGNGIPRNVAECIRKRYLLFLGGGYSDWLFRFIWYSMRHSAIERQRSSLFVIPEQSGIDEDSFEAFLERLETVTLHDPEYLVGQIEQRLKDLDDNRASKSLENRDVFLSYSRKDFELAARLAQELQDRGVSVWLDKDAIAYGELWQKAIEHGIRQAELFVPLLTETIEEEFMEEHEYRVEWMLAEERQKRMGMRTFILPVASEGFDFYDRKTGIPDAFQKLNALFIQHPQDLSTVADRIKEELDKVYRLKQKMGNGQ